MKALFMLHGDDLALLKADWVAARFPMAGYLVVDQTRPPLVTYLRRRAKRIGYQKVADELAWRAYYTAFLKKHDDRKIAELTQQLKDGIPADFTRPQIHRVSKINSAETQALLESLEPDACVATVNVLLKENIFSIPTHGVLVYHPGVTPEYRGVHAAFWASLQGDFDNIGWSLLKVDAGIDTGHVLAQGRTTNVDPFTETHVLMQHKAHIDGLTGIVDTLRRLQGGDVPRVDVEGRRSQYFTHPGWTDYRKLRRKLAAMRG